MLFNKPLTDIIRQRKSIRSYTDAPIEEEKNPMGFIIGAVEKKHHNLEDFGYLMEKNILMATDLGLGTCWLGGTFSSSRFAQKIALQNNEALPAVTPVGYAVPRISAIDSVIRSASGANNRKPWSSLFFKNDKPLSIEEAGHYTATWVGSN